MEDKDTIERRLELVSAGLEKEFGKGTIGSLDRDPEPWPSVSTGAFTLDLALGIGGVPEGRVVEIFGEPSSGKTTLALTIVANAQKMGKKCLYIDVENALDPVYAKAIGVDLEKLLFSQPSYGEEALTILNRMVATGGLGVAVVDSVAALVPKAELDAEIIDQQMGLQARMMSKAMRVLSEKISKTKCTVIFINQIREKMVMFGNPKTTPGGRALPFYSSVRMEVSRQNKESRVDKETGEIMGTGTSVYIAKNKMAPPFKKAEFDIVYGEGINYNKSVIQAAVDLGVIKKAGAGWCSFNGKTIGQGVENVAVELEEQPELMEEIKNEVYDKIRNR